MIWGYPFFWKHPYRSCDTCLIVKTLPFAEYTVSDYTFLSQACREQGKARICPTLCLCSCRYSKRQKVVTCFRRISAGLGNVFRPWSGHIYYRKATMIAKKGVARDSSCRWQRYSKRFHKDIRNIRIIRIRFECFFRYLFPGKGIIGSNHPSTLKLES